MVKNPIIMNLRYLMKVLVKKPLRTQVILLILSPKRDHCNKINKKHIEKLNNEIKNLLMSRRNIVG